jgi:hypothetical protein
MKTEAQIRAAIAAKIQAFDSLARVHKRIRYPKENRLDEWVRLFVEESSKLINGYMIRRTRRFPEMVGIPGRLRSVTHEYEISFRYSLVDNDDASLASEEIAQAKIENLAASFEADMQLGLGASVTHEGLELPNDFEDVQMGSWLAHRALMRLKVTAMNVNCP